MSLCIRCLTKGRGRDKMINVNRCVSKRFGNILKEGKPWTLAVVAAVYPVEVGSLPSVAGSKTLPGVMLH